MNKDIVKYETMLVFYITGDIDNVNEDGDDDDIISNASSRFTLIL